MIKKLSGVIVLSCFIFVHSSRYTHIVKVVDKIGDA